MDFLPAYPGARFPAAPIHETNDTMVHYRAALACYAVAYLADHGGLITGLMSDEQLEDCACGLLHALTGRIVITEGENKFPTPASVYDCLAKTLVEVRIYQAGRAAILSKQKLDTPLSPHIADTHPTGGKPVPIPIPAPKPLTPVRQMVDVF